MGEVEHPGILRDFLVEDGIEWDAIQAVIREAARDHGLLMMVFCLGAQLPADTLGGEIGRMEKPEFGLSDVSLTEEGKNDPLFQGFDPVYTTLHWHGTEINGCRPACRY